MINKKKLYSGVALTVITGMLSSVIAFGEVDTSNKSNSFSLSSILNFESFILFKNAETFKISPDSFLNIRNIPSTYLASNDDNRDTTNRSAPREDAEENAILLGDKNDSVTQLQINLKKLGFYTLDATGFYGELTKNSVAAFQRAHNLNVTGTGNKETLDKINYFISNNMTAEARAAEIKAKADAQARQVAPKPTTKPTPVKTTPTATTNTTQPYTPPVATSGGTSMLPWFGNAQNVFSIGSVATVTDLLSGRTFKIKRTYGYNHADVETLTSQDTATLLSILGGSWSWERRPIKVSVNGVNIAASMAPMPHAGRDDKPANATVSNRSGDYGTGDNLDAVKGNNMDGHFDVHFYGSKTHGTNRIDSAHQAAVKQAYEMSK